jgi:hypothetical protein
MQARGTATLEQHSPFKTGLTNPSPERVKNFLILKLKLNRKSD